MRVDLAIVWLVLVVLGATPTTYAHLTEMDYFDIQQAKENALKQAREALQVQVKQLEANHSDAGTLHLMRRQGQDSGS